MANEPKGIGELPSGQFTLAWKRMPVVAVHWLCARLLRLPLSLPLAATTAPAPSPLLPRARTR